MGVAITRRAVEPIPPGIGTSCDASRTVSRSRSSRTSTTRRSFDGAWGRTHPTSCTRSWSISGHCGIDVSAERMTTKTAAKRIPGYCALCVSRCGSIAVVEDGRFVALEPDPSHPTGQALCAKGRAAPELVYHPDRLLHPLRRTRPKGDRDPGWQRITWDEALDLTAARLRQIAERHGPESVVFSVVSASTSAIADSQVWVQRLMRAFGSPNFCGSMELCGWGRTYATRYTYGTGMGVAGAPMPDLEHASSVLLWGYNPSLARLSLASAMIERGWYDAAFIRDWTNGPLLVRADNGRLLRESELAAGGDARKYVGWDQADMRPVVYDPAARRYERDGVET